MPPRRRSPPWSPPGCNNPYGVAVDGAGNVYIADTGNNAIKEWNAATQHGHHPGLLGAEWPVWRGGGRRGQRLHRRHRQQRHQGVERRDAARHHPGLLGAEWPCMAWRWTARATSTSPTPTTTRSRSGTPPRSTVTTSGLLGAESPGWRGGGRRGQRLHRRYRQQRGQGIAAGLRGRRPGQRSGGGRQRRLAAGAAQQRVADGHFRPQQRPELADHRQRHQRRGQLLVHRQHGPRPHGTYHGTRPADDGDPGGAAGRSGLVEGPAAGSDSDIVSLPGAWTATANASWLHTTSSGTGNGLATFTFDANPGATRTGTLTIAGQTLTVTQAGSSYVAANPLDHPGLLGAELPDGRGGGRRGQRLHRRHRQQRDQGVERRDATRSPRWSPPG